MFLTKNKLSYLAIAKNSSSSITKHLIDLNWKEIDQIDSHSTLIVVLRDPIKRWISGMVEEIYGFEDVRISKKISSAIMQNDDWFLKWIFYTKTFHVGWHTQLQKNVIPADRPGEIVYFNQENNLNAKLHHFLLGEGEKNNFLNLDPLNVKNNFVVYNKIKNFIFDGKNLKYKELLIDYLQPDYDFINSITFY